MSRIQLGEKEMTTQLGLKITHPVLAVVNKTAMNIGDLEINVFRFFG